MGNSNSRSNEQLRMANEELETKLAQAKYAESVQFNRAAASDAAAAEVAQRRRRKDQTIREQARQIADLTEGFLTRGLAMEQLEREKRGLRSQVERWRDEANGARGELERALAKLARSERDLKEANSILRAVQTEWSRPSRPAVPPPYVQSPGRTSPPPTYVQDLRI